MTTWWRPSPPATRPTRAALFSGYLTAPAVMEGSNNNNNNNIPPATV